MTLMCLTLACGSGAARTPPSPPLHCSPWPNSSRWPLRRPPGNHPAGSRATPHPDSSDCKTINNSTRHSSRRCGMVSSKRAGSSGSSCGQILKHGLRPGLAWSSCGISSSSTNILATRDPTLVSPSAGTSPTPASGRRPGPTWTATGRSWSRTLAPCPRSCGAGTGWTPLAMWCASRPPVEPSLPSAWTTCFHGRMEACPAQTTSLPWPKWLT
ncbi:hypothetical protein V8C86DRAFT_2696393 [Haematococcus lacustris]